MKHLNVLGNRLQLPANISHMFNLVFFFGDNVMYFENWE